MDRVSIREKEVGGGRVGCQRELVTGPVLPNPSLGEILSPDDA